MKTLRLLLFVLLCPGFVLSQQVQEPCQSLLSASSANSQCVPVGNCTGLRCEQRNNALNGSSAWFTVQKCEDPVIVDLTIQSGAQNTQGSFTQNDTILHGSNNLSVAMQRNASYLQFQADLTDGGGVVIPTVFVPLNASDCMCSSLADVAQQATHPGVEPECSTNDACDGVYCELDIFGARYYLEIVVLPCRNALDVLVENSARQVLHADVYDRNETRTFAISFITVTIEAIIIPYEYSMDVQAFFTDPLFSRVEVIPRHKIILDKTNCNSVQNTTIPTVAPPTAPPPPIPPPVDAPETCHAFFRIVQSNQSEPFICSLLDQCESGISCRLDILDTNYVVNISLTPSNDFAFFVGGGPSDRVISTTSGQNVTVDLPKPQGGRMEFRQNRVTGAATAADQLPTTVSFQLDLIVPDLAQANQGNNLTTVLIPFTTITVPLREESCQVLRQYSDLYPQCTTLGTCSGAQCQLSDNIATFVVTKCVDPVQVDLTVQSRTSGEVRVQQRLSQSDSLFSGGSSLHVEMGRNATDLQFEVTIRQVAGSPNTTLIPQATVPLNASQCMCQSLEDLAAKAGGTDIEPSCETNTDCDGIVCELDLFGSVYYIENIILPCDYAVDVVVRDSDRQPIFMSVYNRTETHTIAIGFISTSLYVEIVRRPYSMEVSAVVDASFFGNITIVPRHTIILDKTHCDPPHILPVAPPTAPPTAMPPPPSSSETCKALHDIISKAHSEQFFCRAKKDCEAGILCTLEILNTFYTVDITLMSDDKMVTIMFSVSDSNQVKIGFPATSKNTTVSLPKPPRTTLVFNQSVSAEKGSVGFSLALSAPDLGSSSSRLHVYSLIDYSEVPFATSPTAQPQTGSSSTVAIVVPIVIFVVVCFASLLVVLGCMVYCKRRHTILPLQLQFQKMRDGDQEDLEALDTKPENCEFEPDEVKSDLGNEFSPRSEDPDRYEKPSQFNSGTVV